MEAYLSILKNKVLLTVALGHMAIDLLAAISPVLIAFLSVPLGLSNAQVGLAASLYTMTGSLSQPIFGHLADRFGGRALAIGGLLWMALWLSTAAFAPTYGLLVATLTLAGLGSGAYHPQGAMNAFLCTRAQRSSSLSIWSLGGGIGYALGPAVAGLLFEAVGQVGTLAFGILVLPVVLFLARYVPNRETMAEMTAACEAEETRIEAVERPRFGWLGLALFSLLLFARAWTYTGTNTYIPKLYASQGYKASYYGSLLSSILMALALGGLVGGFVADRVGKWRVIAGSLALTTPCFLLFLTWPNPWGPVLGVLAGFCLGASQSPSLVIAQELMPERAGLASGLVQGFAFVTGALATTASGLVADKVGLVTTLQGIMLLPIAAAVLTVILARLTR